MPKGSGGTSNRSVAYARQFVAQMQKPAVDHIDGLSPAIAIEQKNLGHTPRSTVGTVTEIYDYLRILMARLGQLHCPECEIPVGTQTADQVVDSVLAEPEGTKLYLMAPVEIDVGQQYAALWDELRATGYHRVRIDGVTHSLDECPTIDRRRKHKVEVVVDRVVVKPDARSRIADTIENALALGKGVMHVAVARRRRARAELGGRSFTASTWPASSAAAASSRSRRTAFRSTARSAGARRAKGWACRSAPIRRRCCAIRS